jgi:hypothetical protein
VYYFYDKFRGGEAMCREIKDLDWRVIKAYNGVQSGFSNLAVLGYFNRSWLFNIRIID